VTELTFILPKLLARGAAIRRALEALEGLPLDKAWRVEIHPHKMKRSDAQNRYLWSVVYGTIAEHLEGWDKETIHDYCLGEFFGWRTIKGFGKKRMVPLRRSSKLSKFEFMQYLEFIQRRMAEHGIVIPDADPLYFEHRMAAE